MAMSTLKSVLAAALVQSTVGQVVAIATKGGACTEAGCAGYYRAFAAATSPLSSTFGPPSTVTGISVAAIGIQAAANATNGGIKLDVAGFKFKTPGDISDGVDKRSLAFYFGYLGVGGVWDNSTQTANLAGAAAEVVSTISSINVWYNRDGVEGFNWDLAADKDTFNCATGTGYDCVDIKGTIDVKDLIWTPIDRTEQSCNVAAGVTTYAAECKIVTFNTSGSLLAIPGVPVLTLTARVASQPIMINTAKITSNNAKFDVKIDYPWAQMEGNLSDAPNARVALVALHAGKAVAGAAQVTVNGGKSVTFAAAGGKAAYFSYAPVATIGGASTAIITETITGAQVTGAICDVGSQCAGLTVTNYVLNIMKLTVGWLTGFGWDTKLTIHSFATIKPVSIFWDPEVGVQTPAAPTPEPNGVAQLVPAMGLAALVAVLL